MKDTIYCSTGGCSSKLGPRVLSKILSKMPQNLYDKNLLIGYDTSDDASVYKILDDLAIVQTLDFFPAMLEDPYIFGQVAATNALSDIFAMGGKVINALNIVCFPKDMDLNILGKIMEGGLSKVKEAGGILSGGHSIYDDTVKYGLSVTGLVNPSNMWRNDSIKLNDVLVITKPLGVGIVLASMRTEFANLATYKEVVNSMTSLNMYASDLLKKYVVHAVTDVTGFGLGGHLIEMNKSKYTIELYKDELPIFNGVYKLIDEYCVTGASVHNRNYIQNKVFYKFDDKYIKDIITDPQTSGGLLVSMPENEAKLFINEFNSLNKFNRAKIIGRIVNKRSYDIEVL